MKNILLFIGLSIILLSGCSNIPEVSVSSDDFLEKRAYISWADVIMFDGITYQADRHINDGKTCDIQLGGVYDTVAFKMDNVVMDTGYAMKNGDSTIREIGEPVYELVGYSPEFRLAIELESGIRIYEAHRNPNAKIGNDLLDISNKVAYITLNSEEDRSIPLAIIDDADEVALIVAEILSSPIDTDVEMDYEGRYFIEFHLEDGSIVHRNLLPKSNMMEGSIVIDGDVIEMMFESFKNIDGSNTDRIEIENTRE